MQTDVDVPQEKMLRRKKDGEEGVEEKGQERVKNKKKKKNKMNKEV